MSEYSLHEKFGLFYVIAPDLRVITTGYADTKILGVIVALLNKETIPLSEELAIAQAANEAQSEELSKLRQFVRGVLEITNGNAPLTDIYIREYLHQEAQEMVASWDEKQAPETPVSTANDGE